MEDKITFRIDTELKEKLKKLAVKQNRSISNMLVTIIKREVLNNGENL